MHRSSVGDHEEAPVKHRKKADEKHQDEQREAARKTSKAAPNPPRTTTDGLTAPKFGSAGSGGLELEPGPERD